MIHDAKYIDKVYQVIDRVSGSKVALAKRHWTAVLLSIHRKLKNPSDPKNALTPEEQKVVTMYQDVNEPNKFLNAAHRKRLRFQLGQSNRFIEGLENSGRYLPQVEEIFRKRGLPLELTRLPFVESGFNIRARSKVGASGIWQFMRSTGRLFLQIDDSVDERNDPVRAADAAARLLKQNYDSLRSWSLAVTAYNHGRKGMMRAVRKVGSQELEDVVESYRSRSFGFASSNFFTCLLAAVEVEKNADKYFGGKVVREKPMEAYEVRLPQSIGFRPLVRFLKLDARTVREMNPALTDAVYRGGRPIPAGYALRLPRLPGLDPEASARVFLAGYEEIPGVFKGRNQALNRRGARGTE